MYSGRLYLYWRRFNAAVELDGSHRGIPRPKYIRELSVGAERLCTPFVI